MWTLSNLLQQITNIASDGTNYINLRIANRNSTLTFCHAQLTQPLLGADFLAHHHLLVYIAKCRLLVADSFRSTPLGSTICNPITVCSIEGAPCQHLISQYADVFKQASTTPECTSKTPSSLLLVVMCSIILRSVSRTAAPHYSASWILSSASSPIVSHTWTTCLCSRTITWNMNYTWGKCSPYSVIIG